MDDVARFLTETMPRLEAIERDLHNGNAAPRSTIWSHRGPVTLFGAAATKSEWTDIEGVFHRLANAFSDCTSFHYDVTAAGVSGDLAYVVGIERTTCSIGGVPGDHQLRVTTIFRREDGEWKIVHRHGDPPPSARALDELTGRET